jgi:hypothetical protein
MGEMGPMNPDGWLIEFTVRTAHWFRNSHFASLFPPPCGQSVHVLGPATLSDILTRRLEWPVDTGK